MKQMIFSIFLMFLVLSLVACGATLRDLKEHNGYCEFRINVNYEQVYRSLFNSDIFLCYGDGSVQNAIYPESKQAQISTRYDLNNNYFNHAEISALSESETRVSFYFTPGFEKGCEIIQQMFGVAPVVAI